MGFSLAFDSILQDKRSYAHRFRAVTRIYTLYVYVNNDFIA